MSIFKTINKALLNILDNAWLIQKAKIEANVYLKTMYFLRTKKKPYNN